MSTNNVPTFARRAEAVTRYGIPVIPLRPRTKDAFLEDWPSLATTDSAQIAAWNAGNPNYNCAAVMKNDRKWVFEVDDPTVYDQIKQVTGRDVRDIATFIVKSSGEKRHFYFQHDDCSRVMGNRDCDAADGEERFSVRCHDKYVVAPGSIHPTTGKPYEIIREPIGGIPVAPHWLTAWIMKQAAPRNGMAAPLPETIPIHSRNKTLTSLAGSMRRRNASEAAILAALRETNYQCQPPMDDADLTTIARSVAKYRAGRETESPAVETPLRVDDATEFMTETLPARPMLLRPFLAKRTIGMIHASRGVGKTHIMLGMAMAIATGGTFLNWTAPQASPVVYVDGEMADEDIQLWLKETASLDGMNPLEKGYFNLIAADRQDRNIPSLSTLAGQKMLREQIGEAKILFLDNISCLFRGGDEKEATDWESAQEWLISLRREGISVVLGHHDGKSGLQRGTSKREDPLNWVIQLKRPKNYQPEEGLRCEVHFEKARRLHGVEARPFGVALVTDVHGKPTYAVKAMAEAMGDTIRQMHDEMGKTFNEIGKQLGISKGWAKKLYDKPSATPDLSLDVGS